MKITSIITMVLLILTLGPTISSCTTPRPSDPPPIEIEPTPGKPGPNEPFPLLTMGKFGFYLIQRIFHRNTPW